MTKKQKLHFIKKPLKINKRIVRPRRKVTRGARGGLWLQDRRKEWVQVNAEGTFNYLTDKHANMKIDVQFTKQGLGTKITGVLLQSHHNIIKGENGAVSVNGKFITFRSAIIRFDGKDVQVHELKSREVGLYEIVGLHKSRLAFRYFPSIRSYEILAQSKRRVTGLFVDPRNLDKHVLPIRESRFSVYVKYTKLDLTEGTTNQKAEAKKICCGKVINKEKKSECIKDFIQTELCFAEEYKLYRTFPGSFKKKQKKI